MGTVGDPAQAIAIALTTHLPLCHPAAARVRSPSEFALPNSRCFLAAPLPPVVALEASF
jgi:hypothetical protein